MNHTTVDSKQDNKKEKSIVRGSQFQVTERTLEVPPKKQVNQVISEYIEEEGNIEIPAQDDENLLTVSALTPEAIKTLLEYKKERDIKAKKVAEKSKASYKGQELGE